MRKAVECENGFEFSLLDVGLVMLTEAQGKQEVIS